MPKTPDFLKLDAGAAEPLYRQIYARFRGAIAEGLLAPEARIPSARALALELGLARGTVEAAYSLLAAEGYVETRGQAGTVVTPALARHAATASAAAPSATHPRTAKASDTSAPFSEIISLNRPFQLGLPALDAFPRKVWARLAARSVRAMQADHMVYPPFAGHAPLRAAIATYLQLARGIDCSPSQVFITSGYRNTLELIARALLRPGDGVWVEDPGYAPTSDLLRQAGMTLAPVAVDADGLVVSHGVATAPRARAAIVTPAHQSPLCVSLSLPRRLALLDWAAQAGAWIVEDDYDGEYRYVSRPLPALKSLDRHDRVLYAGSFSKVLYPGLALGYVVVPESLVAAFGEAAQTGSNGCPQITQATVADFMREGCFSRHLKKMRLLYARRRAMLVAAMLKAFGDGVRIDLTSGGMHLIARFDGRRESDTELALRAQRAGLNCQPLSARGTASFRDEGLLMGFTNVGSAAHAQQLATKLRTALALGSGR